VAAIVVAMLGSVVGSHLAARRAATLDPSAILSGR
jgi:ABC-type lipoprotein release transport system permease subunit